MPADAQELVLVMKDPDAPLSRPSLHLLATGIAPSSLGVAEGQLNPPSPVARLQKGRRGRQFYVGPGAPPGHGPHRYIFQLAALRQKLPEVVGYDDLVRAMTPANVTAFGQLIGVYERH